MDSPTDAASLFILFWIWFPSCCAVIHSFLCLEEHFNHFVKQVESESPSAGLVLFISAYFIPLSSASRCSHSTCHHQGFAAALRQKGLLLNLLSAPWRMMLWGEIVELNWCGGITRCRQNTTCCVSGLWNLKVARGKRRVKLWYRSSTRGLFLCAWLTLIRWRRRWRYAAQRSLCDQFFIARLHQCNTSFFFNTVQAWTKRREYEVTIGWDLYSPWVLSLILTSSLPFLTALPLSH